MAKLAVFIALMAVVAMAVAQGVKPANGVEKKVDGDLNTAASFYGLGGLYGYGLGYGGYGYGGYGYGWPYGGYGYGYRGYYGYPYHGFGYYG